ncbi:MAG: hypothetical protein RPU34_01865 [Candidatus Sedimenticola sp. (ex Thyasira tokunagai)]
MKKAIQEKLPDDDDVFGFPGINKKMLVACVDDAYQLSYQLSEVEPQFEITILKRKITQLIDDCKEYLNRGTDQWGKEKKFDQFVTDITRIREEIRLTYLVVVDKGLRTESETQSILADYQRLSAAYEQYKEQFSEIEEKLESVKTAHQRVSELEEETEGLHTKSAEAAVRVAALQNESESSYEFTSKYEGEAKERKQYIADLAAQLGSMEKRAKSLNTKAESNRKEFEKIKVALEQQKLLNDEQQTEIQNTLENANRMGMAGSFKSRKEELGFPIKVWGVVFVLAVLAIFSIGYHFVAPYVISDEDIEYFDVAIKILLVSPFVWLAWMSVKQYGYLSRIREDYAYKYASAMAFEGYKKHAVEIDPDLLRQLLQVSVDNLSQNPIRLFNAKDNHASPANELMKDLMGALKESKKNVSSALNKESDNKPINSDS